MTISTMIYSVTHFTRKGETLVFACRGDDMLDDAKQACSRCRGAHCGVVVQHGVPRSRNPDMHWVGWRKGER